MGTTDNCNLKWRRSSFIVIFNGIDFYMTILHYIFIGLEVVLLFNLLIGVHELGHFLAAKWRGLKVDRFAIWFGKPIWKKKINGVEYALGWIPAGWLRRAAADGDDGGH